MLTTKILTYILARNITSDNAIHRHARDKLWTKSFRTDGPKNTKKSLIRVQELSMRSVKFSYRASPHRWGDSYKVLESRKADMPLYHALNPGLSSRHMRNWNDYFSSSQNHKTQLHTQKLYPDRHPKPSHRNLRPPRCKNSFVPWKHTPKILVCCTRLFAPGIHCGFQ